MLHHTCWHWVHCWHATEISLAQTDAVQAGVHINSSLGGRPAALSQSWHNEWQEEKKRGEIMTSLTSLGWDTSFLCLKSNIKIWFTPWSIRSGSDQIWEQLCRSFHLVSRGFKSKHFDKGSSYRSRCLLLEWQLSNHLLCSVKTLKTLRQNDLLRHRTVENSLMVNSVETIFTLDFFSLCETTMYYSLFNFLFTWNLLCTKGAVQPCAISQ